MTTVGLPAAGVEKEPVWMPRKVGVLIGPPLVVRSRARCTSPWESTSPVGTNPRRS